MAKPPLHVAHLVSASYGAPLHICCSHVSWHHLDGAKGHHSRRTFGAEPAHDSALVARCSRVAPHGPPSTTSPSASVTWRFWPLHTFCTEGHPSTPSALKANAIGDRRGGLFLRNNAHKTQAASALSLNHQSTLHQNNLKSHADRSRTPGRTWHDASEEHFPQHPPWEGRFLFLQLLFTVTWTFSVKLLGGGRTSHARRRVLVRVAPTRDGKFSCEAETPRKGFSEELLERASRARRNLGRSSRSNSSEGLLVRGGRMSCERAYSKKLFRDKTISRMNGIPTLEHRLSDLKT
jgi:hypothetical protein